MNSNYFSKNYGYLEKAMNSKSPQTVLHFWLIHKTSNSSHTTPTMHRYITSHRLAPESYSQIFAAESYLSPITSTGNHWPPPRRWRSLADGNPSVVQDTAGVPFPFLIMSPTLAAGTPESALLGWKQGRHYGEKLKCDK